MPALFILIAALLAQSAPTATGTIRGARHWTDGSNEPIAARASSCFHKVRPPHRRASPAGDDGRRTARLPSLLSCREITGIDVQKNGYVPWGIPQPGMRSAVPSTSFTSKPVSRRLPSLHLQKGGVIAGRVLDVNGEPMADARVMALRRIDSNPAARGGVAPRLMPAPGQGQQTNDIGEFRVSGLAPGEYFIAASPRLSPFGDAAAPPPTGCRRADGDCDDLLPGHHRSGRCAANHRRSW